MQAPNILILILDTVRADHLSCYGYQRNTSPFIDSIAKEGCLFEQAVTPAPWSLPAHISILSGLPASVHHIQDKVDVARYRLPRTIIDHLKAHGYQTACFSSNPWLSIGRLDEIFDNYCFIGGRASGNCIRRTSNRILSMLFRLDKGAERTVDEIKSWLDSDYDENKPFFLFVNFMEAHQPLAPPAPYHRKFNSSPYIAQFNYLRTFSRDRHFLKPRTLSDKELAQFINLYDGQINYLDKQVERLLKLLQQFDKLKDTMVVITADHGENFGEHTLDGVRLFAHQFSVHDTLIRVPLILYNARRALPKNISSAVSLLDIPTTIADTTDISPFETPFSHSLFDAVPNRIVVSEYKTPPTILSRLARSAKRLGASPDLSRFKLELVATRDQYHKLVTQPRLDGLFYHIEDDPLEQKPLSMGRIHAHKRAYERLHSFVEEWKSRSDQYAQTVPILRNARREDEALNDRLRALGYL